MKKHTIVLIIICIVSLVTGVVFSVAGLVSLRRAGMEWIKDTWSDSEFVWHFESDSDEERENVRIRIPFVDVYVVEDNVRVSIPGIEVDVEEGRSNVRIGPIELEEDVSESEETEESTEDTLD